jgi:muramoyltetrapeptide carboxypeptidase LdcA involved in peptidoglycan recycling
MGNTKFVAKSRYCNTIQITAAKYTASASALPRTAPGGQESNLIILPPHLEPGDTVGIISPSWGGAGAFPHRAEQGARQIEALGFKVRFAEHARSNQGYVSDTPENRAADIHEMFADPSVRAVISAIGGDHACHLLPLLDFEMIRANPKIFMGFSDTSVLNIAIHAATGLVTFNGPALLTDFAEYPEMLPYTREILLSMLIRAAPVGEIAASPVWTEEFLDWETKKDQERPRILQASPGWTWLKTGQAEGHLLGGCIESLNHLRGTRFWPDWSGAIFFWETSEEKPAPQTIDAMLMDYENMGVLEQISGMLVGRPMYYTDEEKQSLREVILERTKRYRFPIITDMDFGHTAPQFPLPIGVRARIDAESQRFTIIEPAVA